MSAAPASSLFAALEVASGKVIRALRARHRAIEFKTFLQKIDREVLLRTPSIEVLGSWPPVPYGIPSR